MRGALDVRFMPTCLKLFPSLSFFFSSSRTVGAGVGWISRKGGWDAQAEGAKGGGTKNTV